MTTQKQQDQYNNQTQIQNIKRDLQIFCMASQVKNQQFRNQIRRRQKQKIISDLRAKLYNCTETQDIYSLLFTWRDYIKNPKPIIPIQAIKHFNNIQIQNLTQIQQIVNQNLQPSNMLNVIFVTLLVNKYQINSTKFFNKTLQCQKSRQRFQEVSYYTQVKNQQQIYLDYYVKYLLKLNQKQKVTLQQITKVKSYFVNYWNDNIKQKTMNYQLCAQITQRFMRYKGSLELDMLVKGVTSVLIEQDYSPQTYYLIKITLSCDLNSAILIALNPNFPNFIYKGCKQTTLKTVLQIIQIIVQRVQLFEKTEIKYLQLLKIMYRFYMQTKIVVYHSYILLSFYNFAFSQIRQVQQFFLQIDYQQMYSKTKQQNLYNFLDFCLCALYNYPNVKLYNQILIGKQLKLIDLTCDYILIVNNQKTWEYAKDLYETLSVCEQKEILQHIFYIKIQQIKNKLQSMEWNIKEQYKQELLEDYQNLIQKCKNKQTN